MPRRRELVGVARALADSFVSRNNDIGGYWAVGKLYAHAQRTRSAQIELDLRLGNLMPADQQFDGMAREFRRKLQAQLFGHKLPSAWVKQATMKIVFPSTDAASTNLGEFVCRVEFEDDRAKVFAVSITGAAWPHDQSKERQSTRA